MTRPDILVAGDGQNSSIPGDRSKFSLRNWFFGSVLRSSKSATDRAQRITDLSFVLFSVSFYVCSLSFSSNYSLKLVSSLRSVNSKESSSFAVANSFVPKN